MLTLDHVEGTFSEHHLLPDESIDEGYIASSD